MGFVHQVSAPFLEDIQEPRGSIRVSIYPTPCAPEVLVDILASIEGPIVICCWYEGPLFLPHEGALFMKRFFELLYRSKKDVKYYLNCLKGWLLDKPVSAMGCSTPLGVAANSVNRYVVECLYAFSFFRWAATLPRESPVYKPLQEGLLKQKGLVALSKNYKPKGITVDKLFNERSSLFDPFKHCDVSTMYSLMQYVEGYYLIRELVRRDLLSEPKKIQIVFVLPNNESEYYPDYSRDIPTLLRRDFGKDLFGVDIDISFRFFEYGRNKYERPYIDKRPEARRARAEDIGSYFDFVPRPSFPRERPTTPFLRDDIHNINGWL